MKSRATDDLDKYLPGTQCYLSSCKVSPSLASSKLYYLVTEAHVFEPLAQMVEQPAVEPIIATVHYH